MFNMLGDLEEDLMAELYPPELLKRYEIEHYNDSEREIFNGPDGSSKVNILKPLKGTERHQLVDIKS